MIVVLCVVIAALLPWTGRPARVLLCPGSCATSRWVRGAAVIEFLLAGRRRRALVAALPEAVELMARGLRGGSNLRHAVAGVASAGGPVGRSLSVVLDRVDAGERLGAAMGRWAESIGHPDAALIGAVVRLADRTGAPSAASLERVAATLRERAALADEVRALTAQTRASALVVATAPVGFLLLVAVVDGGSVAVLVTTPIGLLCLFLGIALDVAGIGWMMRIASAVDR